jgi:hypothetical protein
MKEYRLAIFLGALLGADAMLLISYFHIVTY